MNAPEAIPAAIMLPVTKIERSPTNPRKHFNPQALDDLATSVKQLGVLQPVLVRTGKCASFQTPDYELVCGERRWRASQIAGLESIPAIVRELSDKQVLEIQVVENLQREDVHPLEEAEGYERLINDHGYSADTLADKVSKSKAYIYARLKLTALAPAARELFYDGKLTPSTALLIARIPVPALQVKAAAEITKPNYHGDGMSHRQAKDFIQNSFMLDLNRATFKPGDAKLVPEAGSCNTCPKRSGNDLFLFADIESADICTDPPCFNNKREVNFLRRREIAEQLGQVVVAGDEAKKMLQSGTYSLKDFDMASLDMSCDEDPERRTFRAILGPNLPPTTLIENTRDKTYVEAVDNKTLAKALKKAGITRKTVAAKPSIDYAAQAAECKELAKIETAWRGRLFHAIRDKHRARLECGGNIQPEYLNLIAIHYFDMFVCNGNAIDEIMALWVPGYDPENESDEQIAEFTQAIEKLSATDTMRLLIDLILIDEVNVSPWVIAEGNEPTQLLTEAARLSVDPEALREMQPNSANSVVSVAAETASTPSEAAQAQDAGAQPAAPAKGKGRKSKEKKPEAEANPAPALPANEPATPVKTTVVSSFSDWPFPAAQP